MGHLFSQKLRLNPPKSRQQTKAADACTLILISNGKTIIVLYALFPQATPTICFKACLQVWLRESCMGLLLYKGPGTVYHLASLFPTNFCAFHITMPLHHVWTCTCIIMKLRWKNSNQSVPTLTLINFRHPEKKATCSSSHASSSCRYGIQVPDMVYCPYKYSISRQISVFALTRTLF